MEISLAQPALLTCPECDNNFVVDVWLIIDIDARPDLEKEIRNKTFHSFTCPHCGFTEKIDTSLLLYRPSKTPRLLFSPAQQTTAEQDRQQLIGLINILKERLGNVWQDIWLEQELGIVRASLLAAALDNDVEEIEKQAEPLLYSFRQFVEMTSWMDSYHYVQAHPELMSDEAIKELMDEIINTQALVDEYYYLASKEHLDLLHRCREIGIDAAFAEKMGISPAELAQDTDQYEKLARRMPDTEAILEIPLELQEDWRIIVEAESRYQFTKDVPELEKIVEAWKRILNQPSFTQMPKQAQLDLLHKAGMAFLRLYWITGHMDELNQVIHLWSDVVQRLPPASSDLPGFLSNLGSALHARYERTGQLKDLRHLIDVYQKAIQLAPAGSSNLAVFFNNLSGAQSDLYEHTGRPEDLEQAIVAGQKAVQQTPTNSSALAQHLNTLGSNLLRRYYHTQRPEDLEQAITVLQKAVDMGDAPDLPLPLANLGEGLRTRYARTGAQKDLDEAIEANQKAVQYALVAQQPHLSALYSSLGNALCDRYDRTGKLEDLEQTVTAYVEALRHTPIDSLGVPICFSNLGVGLYLLYRHTGQMESLNQAIEAFQKAVKHTPTEAPNLSRYLGNLGGCLLARYKQLMKLEDLELGIAALQKAVEGTSPDSPNWPFLLNNLGSTLKARYERTDQLGDLEQAIIASQRSLERLPAGSPFRSGFLNNLGADLHARYSCTGQVEDLERAIIAYEKAIELTLIESSSLPGHLYNLGQSLSDRYALTGLQEDLLRAKKVLEEACEKGLQLDPGTALHCACFWGDWEARRADWAAATHAYRYGMQAAESLYHVQLLRTSREVWLNKARNLHINAAYALAKIGKLQEAVVTLEQGRARILSEAFARDHADLEQLQIKDSEAYNNYLRAATRVRQLEQVERAGNVAITLERRVPSDIAPSAEQFHQAYQELEQAIATIRQISDFEGFLATLTYSDIQAAVKSAPLVYIIAAEVGGLALIIRPDATSTVSPLWLFSLTHGILHDKLFQRRDTTQNSYLTAYIGWRFTLQDHSSLDAWYEALDETTRWLWSAFVGSLIEALAPASSATIIPLGLLGLLPLHAAWTQNPEAPTGRYYASDKITFTYVPNARALAAAQKIAMHTTWDNLLAIDDPRPIGSPLIESEYEVQVAIAAFPHHQILRHEKATREAALESLPKYSVLHFSCHGFADLLQPLNSGLVMANDKLLTLRDLLNLHLAGSRLAILSACETGIVGPALPDEVIGLPSGLLYAGVAGVIATLWLVSSKSTLILLVRFYDLWRREGISPSEALRLAQQWLRDTTNGEKAAYLEHFLSDKPSSQILLDVAKGLYQSVILSNPMKRDFSHPFHWAAFGYTGV